MASLGLAASFVGVTLLWLVLWRQDPQLFRENGPMENAQAGCLFIGMALLAGASWKSKRASQRILFGGLMLLYLTMLVRELDFRNLNAPRLHFWLHGRVRDVVLGFCWFAGLMLFLRNARPVWREFIDWLYRPAGAWLLLAGAGWFLGGLFDQFKPLEGKQANLMAEELLEINAGVAMLAGAIATYKGREQPLPAESAT